MQYKINNYFKKIYGNERMIVENQDEKIGSAGKILECLKEEINSVYKLDETDKKYYLERYNEIIKEIKTKRRNSIIYIFIHPSTQYYEIKSEKDTLDILKNQYKLNKKENNKEVCL